MIDSVKLIPQKFGRLKKYVLKKKKKKYRSYKHATLKRAVGK